LGVSGCADAAGTYTVVKPAVMSSGAKSLQFRIQDATNQWLNLMSHTSLCEGATQLAYCKDGMSKALQTAWLFMTGPLSSVGLQA
jgi:hypothetical protein